MKKIFNIALILLFIAGMSSCTKDELIEPDNNSHCEPAPTSLNLPVHSGSTSGQNGEAIGESPIVGEINDDGDEEDEDRNPEDAE